MPNYSTLLLKLSLLALGAASAGLAFDAAAQEDEPDEVVELDASDIPPSAEPGCFQVRTVRNFHAISDRFVYVEGRGRDRHYLLTMLGVCIGLRGSVGIRISSRLSQVCSSSAGSIAYRAFGRTETCTIGDVEVVESREAAEQLAEMRTSVR